MQRAVAGSRSSNSTSNSSGWKWIVGVGIAVVSVGGIFLLKHLYDQDKQANKTKRKKTKRVVEEKEPEDGDEDSEEEVQSTAVITELPRSSLSEPALMQSIGEHIEAMQKTGDTSSAQARLLRQTIQKLPVNECSVQCRIASAQWLILFHSIRAMTVKSMEELIAVQEEQKRELPLVWTLLNADTYVPEEKQACNILMLDVAQRMQDLPKMLTTFDRILANGVDNLTDEELQVTFSAAPLLGKWRLSRELGEKIAVLAGSLEVFHKAASESPDVPDYEVLYTLAEDEEKVRPGDTPVDQLKWRSLRIKALRRRIRNIECESEDRSRKVRENFEPPGVLRGDGLANVRVTEHMIITQCGAVALSLSHFAFPIQLVGPANDERMHLVGYTVIESRNPTGGQLRQTETCNVVCNSINRKLWTGTYEMQQEHDPPNSNDVKVTFDIEMELELITQP